MTAALKLGLIGDNIKASRAPLLHRLAGDLGAREVVYDLLIPRERDLDFDALFSWARHIGYSGLNITYPYKEHVTRLARPATPAVDALGAMNTICFEQGRAIGYNTDHSGFLRAYRSTFADQSPGTVCLIGSGGVGRAIGFALAELGSFEIRCVDLDLTRAERLADDLSRHFPGVRVLADDDAVRAAIGASGLLNCTAVGMDGIGGQVLEASQIADAQWAFDAVYTPLETGFLASARQVGLRVLSGYELFFGQGLDAWELFSGEPIDPDALRDALSLRAPA